MYGAVTEDVTCVQMVMEFAEHGDLRGMDTFADIQGSIMDTSGTSKYMDCQHITGTFADTQVAKTQTYGSYCRYVGLFCRYIGLLSTYFGLICR